MEIEGDLIEIRVFRMRSRKKVAIVNFIDGMRRDGEKNCLEFLAK